MTQTNRPLLPRAPPLLALKLSHEMLDRIAPLLRGVAKHDRSLADQLRRAAQSVTPHLAESAGHHGRNRRLRYESALGSAYETRACLRIACRWGYVAADATGHALAIVDRVAAMTYRLLRPRQWRPDEPRCRSPADESCGPSAPARCGAGAARTVRGLDGTKGNVRAGCSTWHPWLLRVGHGLRRDRTSQARRNDRDGRWHWVVARGSALRNCLCLREIGRARGS